MKKQTKLLSLLTAITFCLACNISANAEFYRKGNVNMDRYDDLVFCASNKSVYSTNKENIIIAYDIKRECFNRFLENPSLSIFDGNDYVQFKFTVVNGENPIKNTMIRDNTENTYYYPDRVFRLGIYPISKDLINTCGSIPVMQKFLNDNGYAGDLTNITAIAYSPYTYKSPFMIPLTFWLQTDQDHMDYFVTIQPTHEKNDPYIYRIYTLEQYRDTFQEKQGTLKINGSLKKNHEQLKLLNGAAYIPFDTIMKEIGATVVWNTEHTKATVKHNKEVYEVDFKEWSYYCTTTPSKGAKWFEAHYSIIDGEVIIDDSMMDDIIKMMGGKLEINTEEMLISITI